MIKIVLLAAVAALASAAREGKMMAVSYSEIFCIELRNCFYEAIPVLTQASQGSFRFDNLRPFALEALLCTRLTKLHVKSHEICVYK